MLSVIETVNNAVSFLTRQDSEPDPLLMPVQIQTCL